MWRNFTQKNYFFKSQTLLKQNAKDFFFSTHLVLFPVFPQFFEFHQITRFNLEWNKHNCKMVEISYLIIKMFSVVPIERTRGYGHGLEQKTFCLNIRNTYCVVSGVLAQVTQRVCGVSFGDLQKPSGHSPVEPTCTSLWGLMRGSWRNWLM